MFQNVLPRRRHKVLLKNYTTERQEELIRLIEEMKHVNYDIKGYKLAEPPVIDRK
jgi:hypothetical protein